MTGKPLDVLLKDDTQLLGEVVVTALGLKREEKALGYAVTEVRGDELKAANTISPVTALQGKVAGVEIFQFRWWNLWRSQNSNPWCFHDGQ